MSNAMRSGKRALAGVAAGALALGMFSIAGASTATAAKSIKPQAGTTTATAYAVRPTALGTDSAISVPQATMTWPAGYGTLDVNSTVDLLTAPTATAKMYYGTDDTVTLNTDDTLVATSGAITTADDSIFNFNVDTAGTYTGRIYNGTDTVTFSFTTAGAPASMALTPASQTVLVGAQADLELTLLDAAGKPTQPQTVDQVSLTRSPTDDTIVTYDDTDASGGAITGLSSSDLSLGSGLFSLNTNPTTAGTTTITATPLGTLPGGGVTTQTASVIKSGSVSSVAVKDIVVTAPTTAANSTAGTFPKTAQVPEGSTTITVQVDDTTVAAAGNKIRLEAYLTAGGTLNGAAATAAAPLYLDLTTDANLQVTQTFTVGGAGALNNSTLVINQVTVIDAQVNAPSGQAVRETVTWRTPAVQPTDVVATPSGNAVAKVGASTNVSVQVDDSFGVPQSGWTVRAYRTTSQIAANLVDSGLTDSTGKAELTVSPLSTTVDGQSETYSYSYQPPVGTETAAASSNDLTVTYTTSGDVTTMSITTGSGTTSCSNTSCTLLTYPVVRVPSSGVVSATQSGGIYTVSSATVTTAPTGSMMTFTPDTNPGNPVTVTVPEGVKVSSTSTATTTLWSAGSTTATVADNTAVYVWATKTGTHDITFTSGGVTLTMKLVVINLASDAYNIALSPDKQDVTAGGIGTVELSVTDVFGNGVTTGTADDSGSVTITASGEVLLAGYQTSNNYTTGTDGKATVTVIAGNAAGAGLLTAAPKTGSTNAAWVAGYTPPTGAPAPVTSAVSEVTVTTKPTTRTIVITGERGTVKNRPGIMVDGITTGFAEGDLVAPWIKFPGQTSYSEGSARPAIDAEGEFYWQRKTGKKIYVYFKSEDGLVKSDRIIIQAK